MRRPLIALTAALAPAPAFAHDAFGDLGPFYASLLHPMADPLQAALLVGTAAFLASRPLEDVRPALPVFFGAAVLSYAVLALGLGLSMPALLASLAALLAGLAAMAPGRWISRWTAFAIVAATGAMTGLAPEAPPGPTDLQPVLGTILGIGAISTLAWFALESAGRRLTPIIPMVAGSWVAAVGILVGAFSL